MSEQDSPRPETRPDTRPIETRPAPPPGEIRPAPADHVEGKSAAEWITVGLAATDVALTAYNTFKPEASVPPPPPPETPQAPTPHIELPPGVDPE